jgi:hypothetical protein
MYIAPHVSMYTIKYITYILTYTICIVPHTLFISMSVFIWEDHIMYIPQPRRLDQPWIQNASNGSLTCEV